MGSRGRDPAGGLEGQNSHKADTQRRGKSAKFRIFWRSSSVVEDDSTVIVFVPYSAYCARLKSLLLHKILRFIAKKWDSSSLFEPSHF